MHKFIISLVFLIGFVLKLHGFDMHADVEVIFKEFTGLKSMRPGHEYSVVVQGVLVTGPKERFLRARTGEEIASSGLASGCVTMRDYLQNKLLDADMRHCSLMARRYLRFLSEINFAKMPIYVQHFRRASRRSCS
jgi:hypothetical protein